MGVRIRRKGEHGQPHNPHGRSHQDELQRRHGQRRHRPLRRGLLPRIRRAAQPHRGQRQPRKQVWARLLDMDGRVLEETGNVGMVPFLFQGQYYDRETSMAYNRFRYYRPDTGAYISQDPIGLAGGILNLYGYVDDTNTWIDILGLAPWGRGDDAFNQWWGKASVQDIKDNITAVKAHLRGRGGMHEMFPVHLAPELKELGFSARELKQMVIPTKNMHITIGEVEGLHHRSKASSLFHKKLERAIILSRTKRQAKHGINRLHRKHVVGYANKK